VPEHRRPPAPEHGLVGLPPLASVLPPPTATFARDAEAHYLDRPRHCPQCGSSLVEGHGLVVEYWSGDQRVFYSWCGGCSWTGEIIRVVRTIGHEPEDG
jgi:hypothetical protein